MIAGITVLPARLTRVAPAGTATPGPAWTILLPSTTSVAFSIVAAVADDEPHAFERRDVGARRNGQRSQNGKAIEPRQRLHSLDA